MKRRTLKARLTDVSGRAYATIFNMTPAERRAAQRALDKLTDTDPFHLVAMRQALATFIACASPYPRPPKAKTTPATAGTTGGTET